MNPKFMGIAKVLFFIAAGLYPVLIFYFLVIRKTPLRQFSLIVMACALLAFITGTSRKKNTVKGIPLFWNFLLLFGLGALCFIINSAIILKFYPVLMNLLFLAAFGITLVYQPNMIFRFATMQDKHIRGSPGEDQIYDYCRKVTLVWCSFFIVNGNIAAWTIFSGSDTLWSVYNGGISYILIGALFAGEFIVRKIVQKKMPETESLIEKTENTVRLNFSVSETSPYFDGHFPGYPILPAVAQIDMITHFASKYLGTGIGLSEIKRVKFTNPIKPLTPLCLNLVKSENTITFKLTSPDEATVYSAGSLKLRE